MPARGLGEAGSRSGDPRVLECESGWCRSGDPISGGQVKLIRACSSRFQHRISATYLPLAVSRYAMDAGECRAQRLGTHR